MDKKEAAAALEEVAALMELGGENPFKIRSYVNAARTVEQLEEDLATVAAEGRLGELQGVGKAIEKKLAELIETGRLEYLEKLRAKFPPTLFELFGIAQLGPKRIRALYQELGIDSLDALEQACVNGRVAELSGFSAKMQAKILEGIEFAENQRGQHLISKASKAAALLVEYLEGGAPLTRIAVAGSLRRKKELIKDIDIIVASEEPEAVMQCFAAYPEVQRVTAQGATKTSVVLDMGLAVDLRVVQAEQFACALAYFTGSKEHNVQMRRRAKARGWKLNEYGLFDGGTPLACVNETALYNHLGLPWVPPELREDRGEFEADPLPQLVERGDLRGLLHCHSVYSDGRASLLELAHACTEGGYEYMLISDHSQSAGYANGLKPDKVLRQHKEIDRLNGELKGFRILKGIESDILRDGSLDYEDDILAQFDLVIVSIHSKLGMTEEEATQRLVKAVEHPRAHILGHPTGRLLLAREGYPVNMPKLFDACAANGVAVEINGNANRLDCDWRHIRSGMEKGVMFAIAPDAHGIETLDNVGFGLGIARKGWLEPQHLLNCMTAEELLAWRNSSGR